MCHALLQDRSFFRLLLDIDEELADTARAAGCACGGALHRADYPRKPRGCLREFRAAFGTRLSFCCTQCRRRTTPSSVRFLGRRVYLALVVVLVSARRAHPPPPLLAQLNIPLRTLQRWRQWWGEQFPLTPLWQAHGARLIPPLITATLPASLLDRFTGDAAAALAHCLRFLSPLSVTAGHVT